MSDEKKNRITVEIYGQKYVIVGTESPNHIRAVAMTVDEKMKEISNRNPFLDTSKVAVLTAVNAVNEYMKLKMEFEKLQEQLEEKER
ncbi:cell division protein ZapA [Fervidibacillus halotolerans]|uniref:cell division protein ZapA n=1 Tax=Fervidibacillus halotolerans TaxID=2980027 RepID=UPI00308453C3